MTIEERHNYLKNSEESNYPNTIDSLLFVQDADLDTIQYRQNYNQLLQENPDGASSTLEANDLFTPINAHLFNVICSRIHALQEYLLAKEDTMVRIEFNDEPTEYVDGKTWLKEK